MNVHTQDEILVGLSLMGILSPSPCLLTQRGRNSIFLDIKMSPPAFWMCQIAWNINSGLSSKAATAFVAEVCFLCVAD